MLDGIKARMLSQERIAKFAATYFEERKRLAIEAQGRQAGREKRLAQLRRDAGKVVDAIVEADRISPALKKKLADIEGEIADLEREAAEKLDGPVVIPHPGSILAYRSAIENLRAALSMDEAERLAVIGTLRRIVQAVEIHPGAGRGKVEIVVKGALAAILNLADRRPGEPIRNTLLVERVKGIEPSS